MQSRKGLCLPNASEFLDVGNLKKKLTWRRTSVSIVKKISLDITRLFAGDCPMSGANIQACAS